MYYRKIGYKDANMFKINRRKKTPEKQILYQLKIKFRFNNLFRFYSFINKILSAGVQ